MRKTFFIILGITLLCFFIPAFGTKTFETAISVENNILPEEISSTTDYDYRQYNTIKLLHTQDNQIEELALDEYLYGVVSAEMPANFKEEALKAQSVVARTYTFYKIINNENKHEGADICDASTCCQAWISKENRLNRWEENLRESNWNKIVSAVDSTKGEIITYNNEPINAFFHSNSGGKTEIPFNVWGGSDYPYLQIVETSGEDAYTQYFSELILTYDEVIEKIKPTHPDVSMDFTNPEEIKITELTESGRVKTVKFGNVNLAGVEARNIFSLKSTNFVINNSDGKITFSVVGYGHGVGMSQTGADSLAKQGKNYKEIINHYYKDVEIINY